MTKNPFTSQLLNASELMRGLSPAMVRQVLPLLDQLTPIYTDLAQGRLEFTPEPDETKRLIRTFYGQLRCTPWMTLKVLVDECQSQIDACAHKLHWHLFGMWGPLHASISTACDLFCIKYLALIC